MSTSTNMARFLLMFFVFFLGQTGNKKHESNAWTESVI